MSLMIAGERSGVGKTTITLALLSYLRQQNFPVQSFKVGPDYIDPMFHRYVTGRPCRNLDPVLTSEDYVRGCFQRHTQSVEYALVEGVMGLFDGATVELGERRNWAVRSGGAGSTAHLARLLHLPVLLVVDCSRMAQSIAALVHGYCSFDPNLQFAGLVLNRVGSDRHLHLLQSALEPLNLPILGVLRRQDAITIPDRHLGLLPTAELPHLDAILEQLAQVAAECFAWEQLLPLIQTQEPQQSTPVPTVPSPDFPSPSPASIRLAIAQDAAFSFYYADNLDLLKDLGAELVFWSPLSDTALPEAVQGMIFGGGFPEMFAAPLAANTSARKSVKRAIAAGMPTYAECGGLMYLCQEIVDFAGNAWEMVGALPTTAVMGERLTLAYRQVKALQDGVLLPQGAIAWGHEFHRSHLSVEPPHPLLELHRPQTAGSNERCQSGDKSQQMGEGWYGPNIHASYVHLHWGATPELPRRFMQHCSTFKADA
ncbi:MAG: cobyrinate a,c-diamide synthase [Leptolyngbyaceae cyanobacterium bins.349]|nr:cobyrinate a,c-diamide synthase [Leptolyngbyaceae cyanobacterium bins.349]